MLRIICPYCGTRDQVEFRCGGEANRSRPEHPAETSDREWAEYLFYRENPKGLLRERWLHAYGCRQWFIALRDTLTHEIVEVFPMDGTPRPPGQDRG